jgi:hypothetical protein
MMLHQSSPSTHQTAIPLNRPTRPTDRRLLALSPDLLSARAAALFSTVNVTDPDRRRRLLRANPGLLSLPTETLENKLLWLAAAMEILHGGAAAARRSGGSSSGSGGCSGEAAGAAAAARSAAAAGQSADPGQLEHACWLSAQLPTILGLDPEKLTRRARQLRQLAERFGPWVAQLEGGRGSARPARALMSGGCLVRVIRVAWL